MSESFSFDQNVTQAVIIDLLLEALSRLHVHSDLLASMMVQGDLSRYEQARQGISADKEAYRRELLNQYWAKFGPDLGEDLQR